MHPRTNRIPSRISLQLSDIQSAPPKSPKVRGIPTHFLSSSQLAIQDDQNQQDQDGNDGGGYEALLIHADGRFRKDQDAEKDDGRRTRAMTAHRHIIFLSVPDDLSIDESACVS